MNDPMKCEHREFMAMVRFAIAPGADAVERRWMVLKASCEECGMTMIFPSGKAEYAVEIVPLQSPKKSRIRLVVDNALKFLGK